MKRRGKRSSFLQKISKGYGVFETKLGTNYAVAVFHPREAAASAKGDLFLNGNGIGRRRQRNCSLSFLLNLFRCGQETRVIPRLLQIRTHWLKSQKESLRLEEAGLHKDVSLIVACKVFN